MEIEEKIDMADFVIVSRSMNKTVKKIASEIMEKSKKLKRKKGFVPMHAFFDVDGKILTVADAGSKDEYFYQLTKIRDQLRPSFIIQASEGWMIARDADGDPHAYKKWGRASEQADRKEVVTISIESEEGRYWGIANINNNKIGCFKWSKLCGNDGFAGRSFD